MKGPRTAMKSGPRTAMRSGPRLPQLEKALARTEDPTQSKINKVAIKKKKKTMCVGTTLRREKAKGKLPGEGSDSRQRAEPWV